jgi:hypothetical protein
MGYGIDTMKNLMIQKFEFFDTYETWLLNRSIWQGMSVLGVLPAVTDLLIALESGTNKGFLTQHDLSKFPVVSEMLQCFLEKVDDESCVKGVESMETYKWLYNVLILNLYVLVVESLQSCYIDEDVEGGLKSCERDLFERLDPSIRLYLVKRGISIKENVYVGFDTEFTKIGLCTNRIVSSQLAVSSKIYLKVPRLDVYKLAKVDEQTNKLILLTKSSSGLKYSKVESSIQSCIVQLRQLKFGGYDNSMKILTECLCLIKGVSYKENEDSVMFGFPRTSIQPYIKLGSDFSLSEMMQVSASIATPQLQQMDEIVKDLFVDIKNKGFSLANGRDKLLELIYAGYQGYSLIQDLANVSENVLPYYTDTSLVNAKGKNEKSLSRSYLYLPERVSVTKKRVYTVIAHLTPADFSLLNDFDVYKEELSIVNGSYVTIGKPIKVGERCVHVRDTMLLAPGLSKSLDSIGKLYNTGFNKIKISTDDLENMHLYLEREKDNFIDYAIRDAVISLVHAT